MAIKQKSSDKIDSWTSLCVVFLTSFTCRYIPPHPNTCICCSTGRQLSRRLLIRAGNASWSHPSPPLCVAIICSKVTRYTSISVSSTDFTFNFHFRLTTMEPLWETPDSSQFLHLFSCLSLSPHPAWLILSLFSSFLPQLLLLSSYGSQPVISTYLASLPKSVPCSLFPNMLSFTSAWVSDKTCRDSKDPLLPPNCDKPDGSY